ncbi:hypothetical protein ACLOJK_039363 [Asimina triloba]
MSLITPSPHAWSQQVGRFSHASFPLPISLSPNNSFYMLLLFSSLWLRIFVHEVFFALTPLTISNLLCLRFFLLPLFIFQIGAGVEAAAAATTTTTTMPANNKMAEKSGPEQALKCPRCDSSNTKFCYYNNYSLSQPRHFCKACKRYWTRGGTLRNVPVGGGCRKNKRVKKPVSSSDPPPPPPSLPPPPPSTQIDVPAAINPAFYGLPNAPPDINLALPRLLSRLAGPNAENLPPMSRTAYDFQPQMNSMWSSFPSMASTSSAPSDEFPAGFHSTQIQDPVSNSPSHLPDFSLLGSSATSTAAASFIASSLQQQKLNLGSKDTQSINDFQVFLPFEDLNMAAANGNSGLLKGVKMEEESNVMINKAKWHVPCDNPFDTVVGADSSNYWNTGMVGGWPDVSSYGSSITPLI